MKAERLAELLPVNQIGRGGEHDTLFAADSFCVIELPFRVMRLEVRGFEDGPGSQTGNS